MLRRAYDWCIAAADKPHALWLMGFVSFVESSFFPIPPDTMLIPMSLARPDRAWSYATLCTVTSVAGGVLGQVVRRVLVGINRERHQPQVGGALQVQLLLKPGHCRCHLRARAGAASEHERCHPHLAAQILVRDLLPAAFRERERPHRRTAILHGVVMAVAQLVDVPLRHLRHARRIAARQLRLAERDLRRRQPLGRRGSGCSGGCSGR